MIKRILIVDQDKTIRKICRWLLEEEGFKTEDASSGKEALELFYRYPFDLVLTEMDLPDISGKRLKKMVLSKVPGCPIVFMSCEKQPDNEFYLLKPFGPRGLITLVLKILFQ